MTTSISVSVVKRVMTGEVGLSRIILGLSTINLLILILF